MRPCLMAAISANRHNVSPRMDLPLHAAIFLQKFAIGLTPIAIRMAFYDHLDAAKWSVYYMSGHTLLDIHTIAGAKKTMPLSITVQRWETGVSLGMSFFTFTTKDPD
jgi:hypothetical protein